MFGLKLITVTQYDSITDQINELHDDIDMIERQRDMYKQDLNAIKHILKNHKK